MQTKCEHCGSIVDHPGVCPNVKAIEYYESGSIKRIEYKCVSDFLAPLGGGPWVPGPLTFDTTIKFPPAS